MAKEQLPPGVTELGEELPPGVTVLEETGAPSGDPAGGPGGRTTQAPIASPGLLQRLGALGNQSKPGRDTAVNPPLATVAPMLIPGVGVKAALARILASGGAGAVDAKMAGQDPLTGGGKAMILPALIEGASGVLGGLSRLPGFRGLRGPAVKETVTEYSQSPWAAGAQAPPPATIPSKILGPNGLPAIPNMPNPAATTGPAATTVTRTKTIPGAAPSLPPQIRQILEAVSAGKL